MSTRISSALATRLYKRLPARLRTRYVTPEMRDWVDLETGGELDTQQLDMLTDWVMTAEARIRRHGRH